MKFVFSGGYLVIESEKKSQELKLMLECRKELMVALRTLKILEEWSDASDIKRPCTPSDALKSNIDAIELKIRVFLSDVTLLDSDFFRKEENELNESD